MTITAKFNSRCPKCGQYISAGEKVSWTSGQKAEHLECPKKTEPKLSTEKVEPELNTTKETEPKQSYWAYATGEKIDLTAKETAPTPTRIARGEGDDGQMYQVGETLYDKQLDKIVTVTKAWKKYVEYDGMSLGVGADSGYVYYAEYREPTADELEQYEAAQAEKLAAQAKEARRMEIANIIDASEYPREGDTKINTGGERYSNRQTIYGGGDWFIIQPEWIWHIRNNGMDGDDWARNNIQTAGAGAIGHRIPYDTKLADEIMAYGK